MAKKVLLEQECSNDGGASAKITPIRSLESLLTGLPEDVSIERYERHAHTIELFVNWAEPALSDRRCTRCSSERCVKKDGGCPQTVRHIRSGDYGTLITFHKPRYLCKDCERSFYMKPGWVVGNMSITTRVFFDIFSRLTSTTQCIEQIAKDTDTSPSIVLNVIHHIAFEKPSSLPETLGVDEFHGNTGSYNVSRKRFDVEKYHCVITDPDNGFVLDILYKATFRELHNYFMAYPLHIRERVRYFCADMRSGFSKVARTCFPNARICIDPFHVIRLITDSINTVRINAWHDLVANARRLEATVSAAKESGDDALADRKKAELLKIRDDAVLIRGSYKILITSPYNFDAYWNRNEAKRDERLCKIYSIVPALRSAREALTDFYGIVESDTFKLRHDGLSEWIKKYSESEVSAIAQAAFSISRHRKGIENAWRYNKSNGPTEGLNKKIKDVKRMGFGAHSFDNFRKRVLLACGSTTVSTAGYTIFDEKNSAPSEKGLPRYE